MSDLHLRGCVCDDCCPGVPAQATRVYRTDEPYINATKLQTYNRLRAKRQHPVSRLCRCLACCWARGEAA